MLLLIDARRDHLSSIESHLSVSKIFGVVAEEETASAPVDKMMHGPVLKARGIQTTKDKNMFSKDNCLAA